MNPNLKSQLQALQNIYDHYYLVMINGMSIIKKVSRQL